MIYFCETCRTTHQENELCPNMIKMLKMNPSLLTRAVNFCNISGIYHLVTSQTIDKTAIGVNKLIGTNLRFEGTHQYLKDIRIFDRLHSEAFVRSGHFATNETAQSYLLNATKGQSKTLNMKIVGAIQEVEWLAHQENKISSLLQKSELYNKHYKGVDGNIINKLTGNEITRVSVKGASTTGGLTTGSKGIIKALEQGTLKPTETIFANVGMADKFNSNIQRSIDHAIKVGDTAKADLLLSAKSGLTIIEKNTVETTKNSLTRVSDKISAGHAFRSLTWGASLKKIGIGALIGGGIALTISGLTNYLRYVQGYISREEAFRNIGLATVKGLLMGATLTGISLFLPAGPLGFIAGLAIGIYVDAVLGNILDEIFGKGAYQEILFSSGYIYATSQNLSDALRQISTDRKQLTTIHEEINQSQQETNHMLNTLSPDWR